MSGAARTRSPRRAQAIKTTHTKIDTPIGELTLVAEDKALSGIYYPGHWTRPDRTAFGELVDRGFEEVERQLREYFAGERIDFELPMVMHGGPFQQRVWQLLEQIPYGQTTTYGEIAQELGGPALARPVGGAVGHNPLSLIVPCHRVVGKNGSLTGYAGGLERKRFLLDLEKRRAPRTTGETDRRHGVAFVRVAENRASLPARCT